MSIYNNKLNNQYVNLFDFFMELAVTGSINQTPVTIYKDCGRTAYERTQDMFVQEILKDLDEQYCCPVKVFRDTHHRLGRRFMFS